MSKRLIVNSLLLATLLSLLPSGGALRAQDGTYSSFTPYSVYGIGTPNFPGTAYNMSMGGTGIASRNRRFVNILNPAAVTARDTLSFMADFGLSGRAVQFAQGSLSSGNNTFNISDFVISFPIYRRSAFMVGIAPLSNVGYKYTYILGDSDLIGHVGNLGYLAGGNGSIYQLFAGGGVTLWDRLSLGAEYIHYFGNIDKTVSLTFGGSTYRSVDSGYILELRGSTAKLGLQYEVPLGGRLSMTLGATYKLRTGAKGYVRDYAYASLSSQVDTLRNEVDTLSRTGAVHFADELGLGLALKAGERWSFEVDYTRSDYSGCGFDTQRGFANQGERRFSATSAQSLRAGFELTPNRNDIRYFYKRWTYRAGAYYDRSYYLFDGRGVTSYGLTLGLTVPVYMGYNGLTLGLDIGQRGSLKDNMIRERYIGFYIGFNIFDIWFRKPRYE